MGKIYRGAHVCEGEGWMQGREGCREGMGAEKGWVQRRERIEGEI